MRLGCDVQDGEGVDLVVYENAFFVGGSDSAFVEVGLVEVSDGGDDFVAFDCAVPDAPVAIDDGVDGCAGMAVVNASDDNGLAGVFPDGGGENCDDVSSSAILSASSFASSFSSFFVLFTR